MRKRILSLLIVLLLAFCALPCAAFAYGFTDLPQPDSYDPFYDSSWSTVPSYGGSIVSGGVSSPVIYKEPSAVYASRGDIPDALRVEATSYDGGFIGYQWYMSYSGSSGDMFPKPAQTARHTRPNRLSAQSGTARGYIMSWAVREAPRSSQALFPLHIQAYRSLTHLQRRATHTAHRSISQGLQ